MSADHKQTEIVESVPLSRTIAGSVKGDNTRLSILQINNLIAGNRLAAELPASAPTLRRFADVTGYMYHDRGMRCRLSGTISRDKQETAMFQVRDYEIAAVYIENGWDATEDECVHYHCKDEIPGISGVEQELLEHLSDLSLLVPEWKTACPL